MKYLIVIVFLISGCCIKPPPRAVVYRASDIYDCCMEGCLQYGNKHRVCQETCNNVFEPQIYK